MNSFDRLSRHFGSCELRGLGRAKKGEGEGEGEKTPRPAPALSPLRLTPTPWVTMLYSSQAFSVPQSKMAAGKFSACSLIRLLCRLRFGKHQRLLLKRETLQFQWLFSCTLELRPFFATKLTPAAIRSAAGRGDAYHFGNISEKSDKGANSNDRFLEIANQEVDRTSCAAHCAVIPLPDIQYW